MKRLKKDQKRRVAEALAKCLEKYDWNVHIRECRCPRCEYSRLSGDEKFCPKCGVEVPLSAQENPGIDELWEAFKAGLRAYEKI